MILYSFVVYYPLAHQIWGGGWLFQRGAQDFAGGAVIYTASGASSLMMAALLEKSKDFGKKHASHNIPMSMWGVATIFITWFGFNGGSSYGLMLFNF